MYKICSMVVTTLVFLSCIQNISGQETSDYYATLAHPDNGLIAGGSDWMKRIDGSRKLSRLSIPGTHDTCARYGGVAAECQTWSLPDQLKSGIRYLDIRCRNMNGSDFTIHHGRFYQKKSFWSTPDSVLNECSEFLRAHPTECLIMRIKNEHDDEDAAPSGDAKMRKVLTDKKYSSIIWHENKIPTLDEVRGKIVVLNNFSGLNNFGISWADTLLNRQDLYKVYGLANDQDESDQKASLPQKKRRIREKIHEATTSDGSQLFINHCSGAVGLAPNTIARSVNSDVYEFLGTLGTPTTTGVLIFDFPGEGLISRVINLNSMSHTHQLTVTKVFCDETDEAGADEVFLRFGDGSRFPANTAIEMNEGSESTNTWNPNYSHEFSTNSVTVSLWEDDDSSGDDCLGTFSVPASTVAKNGSTNLKSDGEYTVYWNVTPLVNAPTNFDSSFINDGSSYAIVETLGTNKSIQLVGRSTGDFAEAVGQPDNIGDWTTFRLDKVGDHEIAIFNVKRGKYAQVILGNGGKYFLQFQSENKNGKWSRFAVDRIKHDDVMLFHEGTGRYVQVVDGPLYDFNTFYLSLVSGKVKDRANAKWATFKLIKQ